MNTANHKSLCKGTDLGDKGNVTPQTRGSTSGLSTKKVWSQKMKLGLTSTVLALTATTASSENVLGLGECQLEAFDA